MSQKGLILAFFFERVHMDKQIGGFFVSGHKIKVYTNQNSDNYVIINHKQDLVDLFKNSPVNVARYTDHMNR